MKGERAKRMNQGFFSCVRWGVITGLLVFVGTIAFAEEEYKFDISEFEKKPYHVGGYLEFRPTLFVLDKDAALYKLKFFNRNEGDTIEEYVGRLWIE